MNQFDGLTARLVNRALQRASSPCYNSPMWTNFTILALVTLQRLVELYIARRNTKRLMANGGIEVSSGHYPLIVLFHAVWLAGLWYMVWGAVARLDLGLCLSGAAGGAGLDHCGTGQPLDHPHHRGSRRDACGDPGPTNISAIRTT